MAFTRYPPPPSPALNNTTPLLDKAEATKVQAVAAGQNVTMEDLKPPPQLAPQCRRDYMAFTRYPHPPQHPPGTPAPGSGHGRPGVHQVAPLPPPAPRPPAFVK